MIALFGAYDRIRCLRAGLKELGAMVPHARLSPRSGETRHTGNVLVRYDPCLVAGGHPLSAAMLRPILRTAQIPHAR